MQLEDKINEVISELYPSTEEYRFEDFLNNSTLEKLSEICVLAEKENSVWLQLLDVLQRRYGQDAVIEYTLLIHKEPCYRCYIKVNDNGKVANGFILQISVIADLFYIYQQVVDREKNRGTNAYDPAFYETADYKQIESLVYSYFPSCKLLPYELAFKELDGIKVPNKYSDDKVRVFDCLFNDRML
jgi:hypothetical protein